MPAVPSNVADAVRKRWPDRGPQWLNTVHDELRALCERYDAEPVQVMRARFGFVVEIRTPTSLLVLRSSPDPNGINQALVSSTLADLGLAPKIHELVATDTGAWTVADRVLPGLPLDEAGNQVDPAALAALLQPMVGRPAPRSAMPSLTDWLRDRLADPQPGDLPPGRRPAPATERRQAQDILDALTNDSVGGLCHGDASARNILVGKHSRLWFVDPRGMTGEAAYDVAVIALKAAGPTDAPHTVKRLAQHVEVDQDRAHAWIRVANAARV